MLMKQLTARLDEKENSNHYQLMLLRFAYCLDIKPLTMFIISYVTNFEFVIDNRHIYNFAHVLETSEPWGQRQRTGSQCLIVCLSIQTSNTAAPTARSNACVIQHCTDHHLYMSTYPQLLMVFMSVFNFWKACWYFIPFSNFF